MKAMKRPGTQFGEIGSRISGGMVSHGHSHGHEGPIQNTLPFNEVRTPYTGEKAEGEDSWHGYRTYKRPGSQWHEVKVAWNYDYDAYKRWVGR